jgi:2-amino-4-hydroxy-6-hydroxymethyldihydropteridine diphosphokinase
MTHIAYLSLGSNIGDREGQLREAIRRLSDLGQIAAISSFYETEPVEVTDQEWFLNCAVALATELEPAELLHNALSIEKAMGRERVQNKGPRSIDIDIVLFGDAVVNTPELTVPHPAMAARRFVLQPLAEIAPDLRHPVLQKTVEELLSELPRGQKVEKV